MEQLILEIFNATGRMWNINGILKVPSEESILEVFDHAAEVLFSLPENTILNVGGLKIEKNEKGMYDVYVHVGEYA